MKAKPKQPTYKFRPVDDLRKGLLRGVIDRVWRPNWQSRHPGFHAWQKRPLNECTLGRLAGVVHHRTSHGVKAGAVRWKQADVRLRQRFPMRSVSTRYANTYSAHRFL